MKKLLMIGLASILLTGLVACKQNNATDQTAAPADQTAVTQPADQNATQPAQNDQDASTDQSANNSDQDSNSDQNNGDNT